MIILLRPAVKSWLYLIFWDFIRMYRKTI